MAVFFIVANTGVNGRGFQFAFDTDEAQTVAELTTVLNSGAIAIGKKSTSNRRDEWEDFALSASIVGSICLDKPK